MPREKKRRSIRLKDYDYSQPGAYFVTVVTLSRKNIFGEIAIGTGEASAPQPTQLSLPGEIVLACWKKIPRHFPFTRLDEFIIMPNHCHGIIWLLDDGKIFLDQGQPQKSIHTPDKSHHRAKGTQSGSLNAVVQNFKSISTRKINKIQMTPDKKIWQRGYYERVIRNERELNAIRQYIQSNPHNWTQDPENPDHR